MRGPPSFIASERSEREEEIGRSGGGREDRNLPYGHVKGDGSKRGGCGGPGTAVGFAERAGGSLGSAGPSRAHGRETYSEKIVPVTVIEITWLSTRQDDSTTKWNEYVHSGFPKHVIVHSAELGNEAKGCATVGSLEPYVGQAVDEMVRNGMDIAEWPTFREGRMKKS